MELNFGENIKRLRRNRDLTQEALADALGVSAQSVSKWECAYGYPDITQLPAIANFFGVTIDELLSNDKDGKEAQLKKYVETVKQFEHGCDEQIAFMTEYYRRYPDDLQYCVYLSNVLTYVIMRDPAKRAKYTSLFKHTVEKLLDSPEHRNTAIYNCILACEERELEQYSNMAACSVEYTRRNMLINRYTSYDDIDNQIIHQGLAFIENMVQQLDTRYPDALGPVNKAEYHKGILAILDSFSVNGNVPDGWLAVYAYKQLVLAACLFGMGDWEEGKKEFLSAIEKLHRFFYLTDDFLDMGGILFGNLKMNKAWSMAIDSNGGKHELYDTYIYGDFSQPSFFYDFLTNPRWAWFDGVRDEEYFKEAVQWLKNPDKKR